MKKIFVFFTVVLTTVMIFTNVESHAQEKFDKNTALWYEIVFTDFPQFNHEAEIGNFQRNAIDAFIECALPNKYGKMYKNEALKVIRNDKKMTYTYNDKILKINLNTGVTVFKCNEFTLTLHNFTDFMQFYNWEKGC